MIFYVNTYLEGLQELSYFIFFITGEVSMNYWKVTDKAGTANFWECMFLKFFLSSVGWIWKFYLLIYVLDGIFTLK